MQPNMTIAPARCASPANPPTVDTPTVSYASVADFGIADRGSLAYCGILAILTDRGCEHGYKEHSDLAGIFARR